MFLQNCNTHSFIFKKYTHTHTHTNRDVTVQVIMTNITVTYIIPDYVMRQYSNTFLSNSVQAGLNGE